MKFLLPVIITVMVLLAPLSISAAEKKDDQHIKSIFFQKSNGREIVQIRLSGKIVPKVFELGGEKPRVVLDFVETGYQQDKIKTIKAGGELVSKIRVGLHDKPIAKTRVVIDMVEGMKYSFSKEYIAANTIFRITFSTPQAQKTEQQKVPISPAEHEKNTESAVHDDGENKKIEPSGIKKEVTKSVIEKVAIESKMTMNLPEQTAEIPDITEEREGDSESANREGSFEEKKGEQTVSVKSEVLKVEDENTQILLDVGYEKNTNGNEMVLFHLNGFYPPVVYSTESGDLLVVCDFLDAELGPDSGPVSVKGGRYIRKIKVEPHQQPKKVRVVIELAEKHTYDVKQVFFKEENLFVIVLSSLGEKKREN